MQQKTLFITLLTFLNFNFYVNSQCISDQSNIYSFTYNNNLYKIVKEAQDWTYAQSCAYNEGGQLAQIDSQDEQDSIFKYVNLAGIIAANTVAPDGGNASYLWLGGTDVSVEGSWNWAPYITGTSIHFWQGTGATGSAVGGLYNNWGSSGIGAEPDNYGSGQDGLGFAFTDWPLGAAGQWNDVDHSNSLYYIIEYIGDPTGIDEIKPKSTFDIFPNPCSNNITVRLPIESQFNKTTYAKIYDLFGAAVKEVALTSKVQKINVEDLANGVYFIKIENELIENVVKKIVIQK